MGYGFNNILYKNKRFLNMQYNYNSDKRVCNVYTYTWYIFIYITLYITRISIFTFLNHVKPVIG